MTTLNAGYPVFCGAATRLPHAEAEDQEDVSVLIVGGGGGGGKHGIKNALSFLAPKADLNRGQLTLWELPPRRIDTESLCCSAMALDVTGRLLVAAMGKLLRIYALKSLTEQPQVGEISLCAPGEEKATAEVVEIAFDGGGHIVVVGFANGVLQAFDLQNAESLRQALFKKEGKGGDLPDARLQQLWRKNVDDSQIMALTFSAEPEWPLEAEEGPLLLSATKDGKLRVWIADDNGAEERLLVDVGERMPPKKGQGKVFCRGAAWLRYQGPGDPSDKTEEAVIHVAAGLGPARGPTFIGIWEVKGNKSEALSSNCVGLVKITDAPCSKIRSCPWAQVIAVGTSDGFVFCMSYDEVGKLVPVFRTRQPNHSFPVTTLAFPRLPNNLDPEEEDPTSGMLWTLASASPDYNVALMQPSFGEGDGTCGSAILGFMCYLVIAIIIATVAFTAMVSVDPTARQSLENFLRANEEDEEIQAEL